MITASEARRIVEETVKKDSAKAITELTTTLSAAVKQAVVEKKYWAEVAVPESMDQTTLALVKKGLEKNGYRVSLDVKAPDATAMYRQPRQFINLNW